ncbi:MAG TPA: protein kinase [Candidatus Krumholzibacteria bacterium]
MVIDPIDVGGLTISHYRILERMGGGGMGVIYKAEDVRLKVIRALKFLPPALTHDEDATRRFIGEAQVLSSLDHPNICTVHEIDQAPDGRHFICMNYYDGETLDRRLKRGPLPVEEALRVVAEAADGLACAHAHDIIHRDITPANLMVTSSGDVKILDFGLARLSSATRITRYGVVVGTCAYMSPEQTRGDDDLDGRSDIWSLGVVLYELVTGRGPFCADNRETVFHLIGAAHPKPIKEWVPRAPAQLQRIIDKALQKDPALRYASASEMRDDLRSVIAGGKAGWATLPRRYLRLAAVLAVVASVTGVLALDHSVREKARQVVHLVPTQMHVAVLPFENVGNDPVNQAFCDGLTETLTAQLTHLEQLRGAMWTVPSSEVRAMKVTSPTDARKILGANLVVTGAVQRFGPRFRVTMNLVQVRGKEPRQLSSGMIDNLTANMSILQDEAVMWIVDMLQLRLLPQEKQVLTAGRTSVSEAYTDYLDGQGYVLNYQVEGNLDRAIGAFSAAVDHDSLYALAYSGLGEAYWRKYKETTDPQWVSPAIENGRRAVALDTLLAPARVTLGIILNGTGKPERAVPEFEKAIKLEPKNVLAYRSLAAAYAALDRTTDAEATYQRAIDMKPDYWGGYYEFGKYYYSLGDYEKAVAQFGRVVEHAPDNKYGYLNLGVCYFRLGKMDAAREQFEKSNAAEPNFRAYSFLGALYYMEGDYARSAEMCLQARKLNDTNYSTWVNLANAYYFTPGRRSQAMDTFRRAAELAEDQRKITPNDANLLASLAGYYAVLGEKERAQELMRKSLELAPESSIVLYFAGHASEQLGRRDDAFDLIGKAIDNGYALAEVEKDPWLAQLRRDPRFARLEERGHNAELKRAQAEKK